MCTTASCVLSDVTHTFTCVPCSQATCNVHVRNVSLHLTSNCALRISWHISVDTWIHVRVLEQYCSQATRDNAIAFHAVKINSVVQYYMPVQCKQ